MNSVFTSCRVTLAKPGDSAKVMGFASIVVADAMMITGIRIVQGTKGVFVSMPTKKNSHQEYVDIAFPVSKEMCVDLSDLILREYQKVALQAVAKSAT
jgi:stage V sporulation protein G